MGTPPQARSSFTPSLCKFFRAKLIKGVVNLSLKGIDYLRRKLTSHKLRVDMRYEQYAMKKSEPPVGITIPPQIRERYRSVIGWATKGVDSLADRLVFREFANDEFEVNSIFEQNNPDVFFDSVVLSALIGACCFVYITEVDGYPRLQVIEASNATGVIDPITGLLTEGYAVLQRDNFDIPKLEAYFTPDVTWYYPKDGEGRIVQHFFGYDIIKAKEIYYLTRDEKTQWIKNLKLS